MGLAGANRAEGPLRAQSSVLAVRVGDELEKESLIGMDPEAFFTEPHYHGFPAVLLRLPAVKLDLLEEVLIRAWRIQAPKRLAATLDECPGPIGLAS